MLSINHIDAFYGPIQALHQVSLEVGDNEIISIIGANGAGKSTLMKSIVGLCKVENGEILFNGKHMEKTPTHEIIRSGIVYVPEGRRILAKLSVRDNLEMGAYCRNAKPKEITQSIQEVFEIFPRLKERIKQAAGTLSGGEQQMLAIARGLMADPKLLMLDEPSMGLAPIIVDEMFSIIADISRQRNLPILLVEQNAFVALGISKRCYILENGHIVLSGSSKELQESSEVKKSYLGG